MVYELLKRVIEQQNPFMTNDMIRLQIEFFYTAGRLTEEERNELLNLLEPERVENTEEDLIEE